MLRSKKDSRSKKHHENADEERNEFLNWSRRARTNKSVSQIWRATSHADIWLATYNRHWRSAPAKTLVSSTEIITCTFTKYIDYFLFTFSQCPCRLIPPTKYKQRFLLIPVKHSETYQVSFTYLTSSNSVSVSHVLIK